MFYNKRIFQRCFPYRKRYFLHNLKNIPWYFRSMHHLIKYGYDDYAIYETYNWFIGTMQDILKEYRHNHKGFPVDLTEEAWDKTIDYMLVLLDEMDEDSTKYSDVPDLEEILRRMKRSKDDFFDIFSKQFYNLWD